MIEINMDAAFKPDTKEGGIGITIKSEPPTHLKLYIEHVWDNHQLEFMAMRQSLKYIVDQGWQNHVLVLRSDSKIVVQSIDKAYVKDALYHPILTEILELMEHISLVFVKWIPEKQNRGADQLARQALLKQGIVMNL